MRDEGQSFPNGIVPADLDRVDANLGLEEGDRLRRWEEGEGSYPNMDEHRWMTR